jgi:hypothetical protein
MAAALIADLSSAHMGFDTNCSTLLTAGRRTSISDIFSPNEVINLR